MPSFDIVSELDTHEITNCADNAKRALDSRWDFKGTNAAIDFNAKDVAVKLSAESDFQLEQLVEILRSAATKRNIPFYALDIPADYEHSGKTYSKVVKFKQGIEQDAAKKIVKIIKESKIKVTAQIQGEKVRVQGKNRDDLQAVIALMKEQQAELELALQFNNFRD